MCGAFYLFLIFCLNQAQEARGRSKTKQKQGEFTNTPNYDINKRNFNIKQEGYANTPNYDLNNRNYNIKPEEDSDEDPEERLRRIEEHHQYIQRLPKIRKRANQELVKAALRFQNNLGPRVSQFNDDFFLEQGIQELEEERQDIIQQERQKEIRRDDQDRQERRALRESRKAKKARTRTYNNHNRSVA